MTNIRLPSIDHYEDVASRNAYYSFHKREPEWKRLRRIHTASRDSARTPVQWSAEKYAGFSQAKPWFYVNPNYRKINAEAEEKNPDSILNFYRRCLRLRKSSDTLLKGKYREYDPLNGKFYMYERTYRKERIFVICSFSEKEIICRLPSDVRKEKARLLLCNYPGAIRIGRLRPYEAQVIKVAE